MTRIERFRNDDHTFLAAGISLGGKWEARFLFERFFFSSDARQVTLFSDFEGVKKVTEKRSMFQDVGRFFINSLHRGDDTRSVTMYPVSG